ncbi:DUF1674 domain-containing protein [Cohaesibacter sp. CAU 1516]|nr:DUF1674 domain-containing protein [Cohaesibacter sp. CAU 1516]
MTRDPSNTPPEQDQETKAEQDDNVVQFRQAVEIKQPSQAAAEEAAKPRRAFEDLPPAAQRALLEAEERRKERDALKESAERPKEFGGRGGLDPSRYEDYEIGGRTIDF